jgi:hypothetical protein
MKKKKILIYDDDPKVISGWKRKLSNRKILGKNYEMVGMKANDFEQAIKGLDARRRSARKIMDPKPAWENLLDEVDIFIIDYDLFDADSPSGEEVAYLARCYSRCGLIIALNQFDKGLSVFDMTLQDHPDSFADLNIGDPLLDNAGLWTEPWNGYRPWAWPLLPLALKQFEQRVDKLKDQLNQPILTHLGFPEAIVLSLPRAAVDFLTKQENPMDVTFRDFVTGSGSGLRGKDQPYSEESIMRIAAARISRWLECVILPGQNILIDAPHLVSRYPSLLGKRSKDQKAWNSTASFKKHNELGLSPIIHKFRFGPAEWLSRPAWFWPEVSNCQDILEVSNPWAASWPDWVFCEDISSFRRQKDLREFVAATSSPFVQRFVKVVDGVRYLPAFRFAL